MRLRPAVSYHLAAPFRGRTLPLRGGRFTPVSAGSGWWLGPCAHLGRGRQRVTPLTPYFGKDLTAVQSRCVAQHSRRNHHMRLRHPVSWCRCRVSIRDRWLTFGGARLDTRWHWIPCRSHGRGDLVSSKYDEAAKARRLAAAIRGLHVLHCRPRPCVGGVLFGGNPSPGSEWGSRSRGYCRHISEQGSEQASVAFSLIIFVLLARS